MTTASPELREAARELRALLHGWDPIGVNPEGPNDEYDCLVWPLLKMLRSGAGLDQLTVFLTAQLKEHFGLEREAAEPIQFAARLRRWYQSRAPAGHEGHDV